MRILCAFDLFVKGVVQKDLAQIRCSGLAGNSQGVTLCACSRWLVGQCLRLANNDHGC